MFKNLSKATLAIALAALPGVAHAGTATATGTAVLNVINQCTVTGANVQLGSFTTTNTWGNVGAALGQYIGTTYTAGTLGQEYLNFGSVTCDSGTPYTLTIKGTSVGTPGAIRLFHNTKLITLHPAVKKLGGALVADSAATLPGTGAQVGSAQLSGTGSGAAQTLFGNVTLNFTLSNVLTTDALAVAGTPTDTLNYTLNF